METKLSQFKSSESIINKQATRIVTYCITQGLDGSLALQSRM
jgi:hypothetical protein